MNVAHNQKWVIGLTGPILGGKSTALACFARQGAGVISCDELVRQLYTRPVVLKKIKAALGTDQPAQVARLVFKHPQKRKQLESILHPLVLKEVRARVKQATQPIVVVEVPLLFEAGWEKWVDLTICVLADPQTLPARLRERKLSCAQYQARLKTQLPPLEKAARADIVFVHTTKKQLSQSVTRFCRALNVLHQK